MVFQLPTTRDLLKGQAGLPDHLKNSIVRIDFVEPVDARAVADFYRIGLKEVHLQRGESDQGEDSFYLAEIFQPHRVGVRNCPACSGINRQRSVTVSICENPACRLYKREIADGPVRGVVCVWVPSDWIVAHDSVPAISRKGKVIGTLTRELTRGALLVLDRRYPDEVLAAVFRSAKELSELKGWKTKG